MICLVVLVIVIFFLPETLSKEDARKNEELRKRSKVVFALSTHFQEGLQALERKRQQNPHYQPTEDERIQELLAGGTYTRLIATKSVFLPVFLYGTLSMVQGAHDALYPVWMINPKESKGFEWTQTDVGYLYSLLGPVQMISGHILCGAERTPSRHRC